MSQSPDPVVVWHDAECGSYRADLPLWRQLAAERGDPTLDVGAGTGRVTLELARAGWQVTALDQDGRLLAALRERGHGLPVTTARADARGFQLGRRFALIIVPMQTIQLLGGSGGRRGFLSCARGHLREDGLLAVTVTEKFDLYSPAPGEPALAPDVWQLNGTVYSSRPTAVRVEGDGIVLERRRETITQGRRTAATADVVHMDRLSCAQLEAEARDCHLVVLGRREVAATADHVGSQVVLLGG